MAGRTKTSYKVRARKEKNKQAKDMVISGRQKRKSTSTSGEQRKKQKNTMPEEQEASKRSDKEPTKVTKTQVKVLHITESKIVIELDSDDDDGVADTRFDWSGELEPIESLQRVKVEANNADMMDVKPTIVTSDVLVRFMEQQAEENRKRDEENCKRDEEYRK
jgi:putative alpha-1,2-mannosidase